MKIKTILVATDGSPVARKAVQYAAGLAHRLGASVTVLEVVDMANLIAAGASPPLMPGSILMETKDLLQRAASERLDRVMTGLRKLGLRVRKAVRSGSAVEEIIKEAKRARADLIVLGSHGRSALRAAVLGSIAYGVVHRASTPVLIVRK